MLTWSLGWTGSPARFAITSLAFMFDEVPEPVWKTSIGNWSSCSPAAIASAAAAIRSARSRSSRPRSALTRAAAPLIRPSQWITGNGTRSPETGKFSTALLVSAPQSSCVTLRNTTLTSLRRESAILAPLPTDSWDPAQYERFERERSAPFFDLLDLVEPCPGGRVVDLGCGTGELTRSLHERTGASTTLGIDSSPAMLEKSASHAGEGLTFELGDIAEWAPSEPFDVVFSNAALHWVDDHAALFARLTSALAPGGQLAVQVPANHDHPSHLVAERVAGEEPFREALGGYVRRTPVLRPELYAELLHRLGYGSQHVRLQVYLHVLPEPKPSSTGSRGRC